MPFPAKDPEEIKAVTFRFDTEMPPDVPIQTAQIIVTLISLTDLDSDEINPIDVSDATILDAREILRDDDGKVVGLGDVVAGREQQWVMCLVGGGCDGKYMVRAIADTANGERNIIEKILPISVKAAVVK